MVTCSSSLKNGQELTTPVEHNDMPLVVTTALPTGANPLLNQKAAAVWSAIESLVPNFITTLDITP